MTGIGDQNFFEWYSFVQALVVCDALDNKTHKLVHVAPRSLLRQQIDKAAAAGQHMLAASELEYFLFHTSFREAAEKHYTPSLLRSVSTTVEDYHLLQVHARTFFWNDF